MSRMTIAGALLGFGLGAFAGPPLASKVWDMTHPPVPNQPFDSPAPEDVKALQRAWAPNCEPAPNATYTGFAVVYRLRQGAACTEDGAPVIHYDALAKAVTRKGNTNAGF